MRVDFADASAYNLWMWNRIRYIEEAFMPKRRDLLPGNLRRAAFQAYVIAIGSGGVRRESSLSGDPHHAVDAQGRSNLDLAEPRHARREKRRRRQWAHLSRLYC
jgi:hypothetical protein